MELTAESLLKIREKINTIFKSVYNEEPDRIEMTEDGDFKVICEECYRGERGDLESLTKVFSVEDLLSYTAEDIANLKAKHDEVLAVKEKERLERIEYSEYFHAKQRKLQYEKLKIEFE